MQRWGVKLTGCDNEDFFKRYRQLAAGGGAALSAHLLSG